MKIQKYIIISLILMFLIVPASYAGDGDYTIPNAVNEVTIMDDGATIISEDIIYSIEGQINGIYRDIPHDNQQRITNISVETPGYYNSVEIINHDENTRIKVWLYKDEAKTQKIHDENVEIIYKYTFINGVKVYNDIAEFQYLSWGDKWDSGVDNLETIIHIPGSKQDVEYWNNPEDYVISSTWTDDNTLETKLEDIGSHTKYEQRILLSKSYFTSTENAKVINMDAKAQIEEDQRKYKQDRDFYNTLSYITMGVLSLLMIIPLGIYGLYGREPKINYKSEYEHDLPTKSSPLEVNSIVIGNVGEIDNNAIYATILDLINRKYYKIMTSNEDDTVLKQIKKDNTLKHFESSLMNFLSKFEINGDISLKSIADTSNWCTNTYNKHDNRYSIKGILDYINAFNNTYYRVNNYDVYSKHLCR